MRHSAFLWIHSLVGVVAVALAGCPKPDARLEDPEAWPCVIAADCDDGNPCTDDVCDAVGAHCTFAALDGIAANTKESNGCLDHVCVAGQIQPAPKAEGVPVEAQTFGDCLQVVCDGKGGEMTVADDTDVFMDGNECMHAACENGAPTQVTVEKNTPCGTDGSLYCDGIGHCVGCTDDTQCSNGGNFCFTGLCGANGLCTVTPMPIGTAIPAEQQTPQDCKTRVCDGTGNLADVADPNDPEDDGNICTEDVCNGQTPQHAPAAVGTPCNDGSTCDGFGACGVKTGSSCTNNSQCVSSFCVDGVCCDTSCSGVCKACTAAKKGQGVDGTCGDIAAGVDPDGECVAEPAATCGATGFCSGAGACEKYPTGTTCAAAACSGTNVNNADTCDGSGNCIDGGSQSCGNYLCSNASCPAACLNHSDCAQSAYCDGTACAPRKQIGATCASATECLAGFCVDGVCCSTECTGTCMACNTQGKAGICANEPFPGQDLACAANEVCNGTGFCKLANAQPCVAGAKCASGTCFGGICKSTSGQPCATAVECVSGNCINGACQ